MVARGSIEMEVPAGSNIPSHTTCRYRFTEEEEVGDVNVGHGSAAPPPLLSVVAILVRNRLVHQSLSAQRSATPCSTQKSLSVPGRMGNPTHSTKLVDWPVVLRIPARTLVLYSGH